MNYFGISFNMVKFSNVFALCNRESDGTFGFQIIDDSSQTRASFLSEVNLFLEDAMVNILNEKKPLSRNPDILYTEVLIIAKLLWTAANIPSPKQGINFRKTQYDDSLNREKRRGLFYLAFFLKYVLIECGVYLISRDLIFEKIRTILDNPSHYAIIMEKYPNGLTTILEHVEECMAIPCPPPNFPSLGQRFLWFYSSSISVKLLKLRMFVNQKNYIAASNILYVLD